MEFLRDRVYSGKPRTITVLKETTRENMRAITKSVRKNVMDYFVLLLKKFKELNELRLEHMLQNGDKKTKYFSVSQGFFNIIN